KTALLVPPRIMVTGTRICSFIASVCVSACLPSFQFGWQSFSETTASARFSETKVSRTELQ
ncbi:MAG TPA: hypothetical protein VM512_14950, partial [Burkholderiaceae bacterium]|nr:hypothetical protein [Burkholderiaceae bacterium]